MKGALTRAMSKWTKHIVSFNEEEDGDILVAEGHQIGRGTVFLRDTCQREIHQRTFVDKRFPREAPQIERGTVSPRDTRHCEAHPRSIRDKQIPRDACFDLGDVEVEMKRRMKSLSWRKDLKLNAARCLPGTHATARLTQKAFVTSG